MKKKSISILLIMIMALLPVIPAVPVWAADTAASVHEPGSRPAADVNVMLVDVTKQGGDDEGEQLIEDGEVVSTLPDGISYEEETTILTLDNYKADNERLVFSFNRGGDDSGELTIRLVGDNSLLDLRNDTFQWLRVTGDGSLTVNAVETSRFIMDSGTINVVQTDEYLKKYAFWNYGFFNTNTGDKDSDEWLNSFRFLGGEVNIDCTGNVGNRVGMDVQSGNVEIRNAKVRINLGSNDWLGLGVGWTGKKQNGGILTMENATLEITGSNYLAYFYKLVNEGDPLFYIVGKNGPEKEVTFDGAFEKQRFSDKIVRYARTTGGEKGYLMITSLEEEIPTFLDLVKGAFYEDAVYWAVENNITNGTGNHQFSPNMTCSRGQVVTFLWRASGSPEPAITDNPFKDVTEKDYYYKAVLWAVEKGITTGTSPTTFGPKDPCTRGQVAVFLFRAKEAAKPDNAKNPFNDVAPGAYYYDAVLWAVDKGITKGTSSTEFSPNGQCTRGQIVTFLYRALA